PTAANPSPWPYCTHMDRKWGIQFDSQADPLAFVEALEKRAQIAVDALPRSMAEGLMDHAACWFRTSGLWAVPWSEFRKEFLAFFLPTRYFERLEDSIRDRKQSDNVTEIRFLMHHANYSTAQELDRIYDNARPEPRRK
ncbi:hypothetical protein KR215_006370, partial [Drosophila sulfurigaster]